MLLLRRLGIELYLINEFGLSHNTFLMIEFIPFFIANRTIDRIWYKMSIRNHVNLHGSRFHTGMKLGMESDRKKIVCKTGSFVHVLKCINAKIAKKVRLSVHQSETSFAP